MAEAIDSVSGLAIIPAAGPPGVSLRGPAGKDGTDGFDGRDGVDGRDGAGTIITRAALEAIPAWTAVVSVGPLSCRAADPSNPDHRGLVIGVTVDGGLMGSSIWIQAAGDVDGSAGAFPVPATLFVGAGGALVGSPPDAGWRQTVATSSSTTHINVVLGEPRIVSDEDAMISPDGGLATRATNADVQAGSADNRYLTPASAGALPFTHGAPQAMRRTTAGALGDKAVTPFDYQNLGVGSDMTGAVQAAFNQAAAGDYPVYLSQAFNVTSLTAPRFLRIHASGGGLNGIASGAPNSVAALFNMPFDNLEITGRLNINGGYNLAYKTGMRVFGQQTQFNLPDKLSMGGFQVGFTVGDRDFPYGIASETTVSGLHTYGCPICVQVIGTETIVHFSGCQLISDTFGAPSGWSSLPRRVVRSIGAAAYFSGGEACIVDATTGYIAEMQPLNSTRPMIEGTRYGMVRFDNLEMETASPFLLVTNPDGLAVNQPSSRATFGMDGLGGFVSQDIPMSYITAGAPLDVVVGERNRFQHPGGTRTQPTWFTDDTAGNVHFYLPSHPMGLGWRDPLAETVNGVVHWKGERTIMRAQNPGAQSVAANSPSTIRFSSVDTSAGLIRFSTSYSPANGRFTAPVGGLADVQAIARIYLTTPVSGRVIIANQAGAELGSAPIGLGVGSVVADVGPMASGEWIEVRVLTTADAVLTSDSTGGGYLNRFTIKARN